MSLMLAPFVLTWLLSRAACAEFFEPYRGPIRETLSVQQADFTLKLPGWLQLLQAAQDVGVRYVRIDLNWPWVETAPGVFDWSLYDQFVAEAEKRGIRPLFILHRPNPFHADQEGSDQHRYLPPSKPDQVSAFARWAAAAAMRYQAARPVWEIWNEPDNATFWRPAPTPQDYLQLARGACAAIKAQSPSAYVMAPAAAEMPTVWRSEKPLFDALFADRDLLTCIDAISIHTHRFAKAPETLWADMAAFSDHYSRKWPADIAHKPLIDSEWGYSVYKDGITEGQQATWLPRMVLINAMLGVHLTNIYCLVDTGPSSAEREDRFGLITQDGRQRPAVHALAVLVKELGDYSFVRPLGASAEDQVRMTVHAALFCRSAQDCKAAFWANDGTQIAFPIAGLKPAGTPIDGLGNMLPAAVKTTGDGMLLHARSVVTYVPVAATR